MVTMKKSMKSRKRKRAYTTRKYRKRATGKYRRKTYKRKIRRTRKALPGGRGKTTGSYSKMLNPMRTARRELGMLRSFSPGNTLTFSNIAGAAACYSFCFVANSIDAATQQQYLPTTFNLRPADGLQEELYSKFYSSNVVWSSLGLRIFRADVNADYGPVRFALTPLRYSDCGVCLTNYPSATGQSWVGSTAQSKFSNQAEHPHTRQGKLIAGATSSGLMNNTYLRNSIRPEYIYTEPNWQSLTTSSGTLRFIESLGVGITSAASIIWVLTFYFERPTNTSSSIFTVDVSMSHKIKAWDPIPAFLITQTEQKRSEAVPLPVKPVECARRDEMDEVNEEMAFHHIAPAAPVAAPPPRVPSRNVSFSPRV